MTIELIGGCHDNEQKKSRKEEIKKERAPKEYVFVKEKGRIIMKFYFIYRKWVDFTRSIKMQKNIRHSNFLVWVINISIG